MILYLDTSSLVKLYVEESESSKIAEMVDSCKVAATSLIAYAEARAAYARRFREKAFGKKEYHLLLSAFEEDWKNYFIIRVKSALVKLAGDFAEKHALRGFDAIHLSSAVTLKNEIESPVYFSCFDERLLAASGAEGLLQP